jgi:hypothetical protein
MRARPWVPYSVTRLVRLCRIWDFQSDAEDLPEKDNGEPRLNLAYRRLRDRFRVWRDAHAAEDDPWFDESLGEFHVSDVALIFSEYQRLSRFEQRVIDVLGPPSQRMRCNRKLGKFEPE